MTPVDFTTEINSFSGADNTGSFHVACAVSTCIEVGETPLPGAMSVTVAQAFQLSISGRGGLFKDTASPPAYPRVAA